MIQKYFFIFYTLFLIPITLILGQENYIWWEGEEAFEHNFDNTSFLPSFYGKKKEILSNNNWLHNGGIRKDLPLFANYKVDIKKNNTYHFWVRKFWKHGPFKWRFSKQAWQYCKDDCGLTDNYSLAKHICANWVYLGKVPLGKGEQLLEIEILTLKNQKAIACFDCFVLSPEPYLPYAKYKPGEKSNLEEESFWAFEPEQDTFKQSFIDLRYLNEKIAGENGFVSKKGSQFILGNGTPTRFWAVNAIDNILDLSRFEIDYLAKRLAKVGVNMFRVHTSIFDKNSKDLSKINKTLLDKIFYAVTAMKKEGIYTKLSYYFPLKLQIKPEHGFKGYDSIGNKTPFSLLFINEKMQKIYKEWAKQLLTTINPYTGISLAYDPAIAIIEIQNEDSLFFWTFDESSIPEAQMTLLEKKFGSWLAKKYTSLPSRLKKWKSAIHKKDDAKTGRAGIFSAWAMTSNGMIKQNKEQQARIKDQIEFLTKHQYNFYKEMTAYLKNTLGCQSLISAGNWQTADDSALGAIEHYSYTAGDIIDQHGYFAGEHKGPIASYSVNAQDSFKNRAAVFEPHEMPFKAFQINNYPHIISEISWPMPNRFRADNTFITSAYSSLQGVQGVFWFSLNTSSWTASLEKFPISVPSVLGQFPATALQYRRGDLKEAPIVIQQNFNKNDLYQLKAIGASSPQTLDQLRKADVPKGGQVKGAIINTVDPLAFLVGKVSRSFNGKKGDSILSDLSPYIERGKKRIQSITKEINWNYQKGLVTVNSPLSQGFSGFLSRMGKVEFKDITLSSQNEYGTIHAISLDGAPIATSKKILVQAFTEEQPYGYQVEGGREGRITNTGALPLNVRDIEATIWIRGKKPKKVFALDANGYKQKVLFFMEKKK